LGAEADLTGPPEGGHYEHTARRGGRNTRGDGRNTRGGQSSAAGVRWITPLPLWTGILTSPLVWAVDLLARYAIVKWSCTTGRHWYFDVFTVVSLALVAFAGVVSWNALQQTSEDEPTDGGLPRQRARFMAILGLTMSALFGLTMAAASIPNWVLDACH